MSGGGELKTSQRIVTAFPSTTEYSSSSGVRTTGARSAEIVKNEKKKKSRSLVLLPLPPFNNISVFCTLADVEGQQWVEFISRSH